jgi:hypothetical protein
MVVWATEIIDSMPFVVINVSANWPRNGDVPHSELVLESLQQRGSSVGMVGAQRHGKLADKQARGPWRSRLKGPRWEAGCGTDVHRLGVEYEVYRAT